MEASTVLPRTRVRTVDAPPVLRVPLDSTRLLLAMESLRGTREPMRFTGPLDVARKLERSGVGIPAYDAIDVAFREGVPEVWLARLLGPSAVSASIALAGGTGTVMTLTATEPGEWANGAAGGLTAEVVNGPGGSSERVVIIRRNSSPVVELGRTSAATTRAALAAAVALILQNDPSTAGLVSVTLGADTGLPTVAGPSNFAGGTADAGSITATHVRTALDAVSIDEGPMQVATPGRDADATVAELIGHCAANGRTALVGQTANLAVGTITASAATVRALGIGATGKARIGGMWAQHATGPGVVGGTSRTVPWTIIVAGLISRLQATEGHPNVSPIGDQGVPRWATGLARTFTEAEAETLVSAGVNVAHTFLGVPRNRTFHSLEPLDASDWVDLAHTRTDRQVHAIARDVGRAMGGRVITRNTISEFGARLRTRLDRDLFRAGALFGDTFDESARVDVDSVNDTTTIAAREVNAAVGLALSEHAEFVNIDLAKVPIGEAV